MRTLDVKARSAGLVVLHVAVLDPMGWNRPHAVKTTGKVHTKGGRILMATLWYQCCQVHEVMASMSMTWCKGMQWAIRVSEVCVLMGRIDELIAVPIESEHAHMSWRSVGGTGRYLHVSMHMSM